MTNLQRVCRTILGSLLLGLLIRCLLILAAAAAAPTALLAQENEAAATRHYALAVGLQNKKLYPQAAARWTTFIQTYPQDKRLDKAHHYLGICQLQEKKLAEAVATFRTVLANYPQFASLDAAQLNLGLALYQIGLESKKPDDLRTASQALAEVPAKFPQSKQAPAALFYQAEALYQAGDGAAAAPIYQKLIAGYPQSELLPDAHYALGFVQEELGQHAEAAATFQAFLTAFPMHAQAAECKLRLGLCQLAGKKYAEAEATLTQAAAIADFKLADLALLRQAQAVYEQGKLPEATALYQSLPQKFPQSAYLGQAQLAAGKCLYQAGQFQPAHDMLAQAVAGKSDAAPEAAYWQARCLVKLKRAPEAVTLLDQALAAYPQSAFAGHLAFARIDALYEQPEQRKNTVALYLDFSQKNPEHELAPQALYMAALAALGLADYPTAKTHAAAFLANAKLAQHALTPEVLFISAESQLLGAAPANAPADLAAAEAVYRDLATRFAMHRHAPQAQVRVGLCLYLAKKLDEAVAWLGQVAPGLKDPPLIAEAAFLTGRSHSDAGRGPQAIAAYQAALQAKADWTRGDEVLLALAHSLRTEKNAAEAAAQLGRLLTAFPQSTYRDQALYQLGEIAYADKKYDEAAARYQEVVAQFPAGETAPLAALAVGRTAFAKEDYTAAVTALSNLLTAYAKSTAAPQGQYLRGLSYQRLKQFEPAVQDLTAFLAAMPPEADALDARYALALCQVGLKQYDQAAAALAQLLKDKPDYLQADKAMYEMAFALLEAKKDKEAAEAFRQLATTRPDSPLAPESWYRVGTFQEAASAWPEAAAAYKAGLEKAKEPELKEKLGFKLGWVQYQAKQYPDAAATFQAQVRDFPNGSLLPDGTYLAGECLYRQDQFAQALPLFAAVVQLKPEKYHARALYRAGLCAGALQQWPASQAHYQALVDAFPKFEQINEARYGLGWALQNQDKLAEAKTVYEAVTKATDTETAAKSRFMIGECALREKKFDEAIEHFLETAVSYPYEEWQALGHYQVGRCFIELKDKEKAIESLQTVVDKFPKHAKAEDAAKLIAELKK